MVLPSRIPDTDSDSSTSVDMSARRPCVTDWMRRRSLPTRRVSHTKNGSRISENRVSCQLSSEHRDDRGGHGGDRGNGRGRGAGDDVVDAADVVGDARLHLARARAREERQRHALQVCEHRRAQVVHHALADLIGDPRLRHADHAVDDRQRDHARDQPREQLQVVADDALVDGFAQQERRGHAEHRSEHDQPQQQAQAQAIGDEQPRHPAQRHRFVGDVLRAGLRLARPATVAAAAVSLAEGLAAHGLTVAS